MKEMKQPNVFEASCVLLSVVLTIALGVIVLHVSPHIAVLSALCIVFIYTVLKKIPFDFVQTGLVNGVKPGIIPILLFLLVGILIAVWIQAGIIPTLMVYGFKMIDIRWFVPSVFIVCALVGSVIGSAFTVMSTIGIAFFGIGMTLGLHAPLVVGAIVSGAVFGDKMSPLSESTNLTAAIVEADLFKHIKNLLWSTLPAFVVSLGLFTWLGMTTKSASLAEMDEAIAVLSANFTVSPWSLLPIFVMLLCAWRKVPALLTILLNIAIAIIMIVWQTSTLDIQELSATIETGFVAQTGHEQMDLLLSRGGLMSMMPTVALIILTLSLGGVLLELQLIATIMGVIARKLQTVRSTILATLFSAIGVNLFMGEQFLSIVLPGNAFKALYKEQKIDPVVLGRTLEDGGTVINYLIPWGVAGSFVASTFNMPTSHYLPFAFFCLLSPLFSILSALTDIGVKKID